MEDDLGVSFLPADETVELPSEESIPSTSCNNVSESGVDNVPNECQVSMTDVFQCTKVVVTCDATQGDADSVGEKILRDVNPLDTSVNESVCVKEKCTADSIREDRQNNVDSVNVSVSNSVRETKKSFFPRRKGPKGKTSQRRERYDINQYKDWPEGVKYYTGLETYNKFMFVFQSLRTDIFPVKYRDFKVKVLSLENQFFLTLWKL